MKNVFKIREHCKSITTLEIKFLFPYYYFYLFPLPGFPHHFTAYVKDDIISGSFDFGYLFIM